MSGSEATMAQIEIMVGFMERNGDLSAIEVGNVKDELENLQKWIELTDVLNDKGNGDPKTLHGWKKTWENLKTRAQNQFQRTVKKRGRQPKPTEIDKRVMVLMEKKVGEINRKRKPTESSGHEDDGEDVVNEEVITEDMVEEELGNEEVVNAERVNAEGVSDEESTRDDDSNDLMEDEDKQNEVKKVESVEKRCVYLPSRSSFMWAIKSALVPFNLAARTADNAAIAAARASTSSAMCPLDGSAKRNMQDCNDKTIVNLAERYLEFEKKKAVLEHGRELLRIKQDQKYIAVLEKLATTLEVTSAVLSKCLDAFLNML